jgi:tetratricopeptide (TPR) repeat protein
VSARKTTKPPSRRAGRLALDPSRSAPSRASARAAANPTRGRTGQLIALFAGLLLVTLAAYHPAWHGGLLWDDDAHLTRPDLRSLAGLWRIWFAVGATQQYYPVVHSVFWGLHRLWGDDPLGYHLLNIVLHTCSAWLVAVILRRLAVPGAVLAAVIFAVHPVQVESVAWMTELKNTLSGICYLGALLAYLHFDTARRGRWYGLALGLFGLALLSKTVTATLPAALLVVVWWQRGQVRWREDVRPLVPFGVLGIGAGLLTAWVERTQIGAEGAAFHFTLVERGLIAGRVIVFYLGKLLWPANLIFIYPRWQVSAHVWWQYLYPVGVVGLLAACWGWRRRSRAPLAALLFFIGTLGPALGFVNVYPFLYAFVADHFQYLASLGVIVLGAAGVMTLARRGPLRPTVAEAVAILVLGAPLTVLTWSQSQQYANAETLYRTTLSRNPACWLAHNNLGWLTLSAAGDHPSGPVLEEAVAHFESALSLKPDFSEAHNNLGTAFLDLGRFDDARSEYIQALRLTPHDAGIHYNLGLALQKLGRPEEAVAETRASLEVRPNHAGAHASLGNALQTLGRLDEAVAEYHEALRLNPDDAEAHHNLGSALGKLGRLGEAVAQYEETLRLNPASAKADRNLGFALLRLGRPAEAVTRFTDAVRLVPDSASAHYDLANALEDLGRHEEAAAEFRQALTYQPGFAEAANELGVALAELGRYGEAVVQFREALRLKPDLVDARANLVRALSMIKGG